MNKEKMSSNKRLRKESERFTPKQLDIERKRIWSRHSINP
jgi:hypothetical protein